MSRERIRTRLLGLRPAQRSALGLLGLVVAVVVLAFLLAGLNPAMHEFVISTLINLVVVVGLYIFIGNSGVVSFGQVSFMAIGAYATGLMTVASGQKRFLLPGLPHWVTNLHLATGPAMVIVVVGVGLVGAIIAVPMMRLSGIAASIATLSFLIVINVVIVQTTSWTGGNQAFIGVPLTTTTGLAVACVVVAVAIAFWFERSSIGLRLRATREDEPAARAAGIGVLRERTVAFAISAGIVALAGALYAHFLGSFDPSAFYLETAFLTLAMLVVGGMYTLMGAIVGTIVLAIVQEILGRLENGEGVGPIHLTLHDGTTEIVLAVVVIVVLLFRPGGIMGGGGWRPRRRSADIGAGDDGGTPAEIAVAEATPSLAPGSARSEG
jgi:branched-chain amino acid transport system permease protein